MPNIPIGKLLVANGLLTQEQLDSALKIQSENPGKRLGDILLEQKYVSEKDLMLALESRLNVKFIELREYPVSSDAVSMVDEQYALEKKLIPVNLSDDSLVVATAEPMDFLTLDDLRLKTGYNILPVLSTTSDIEYAIRTYYNASAAHVAQDINNEFLNREAADGPQIAGAAETPVVKYVNTLLGIAAKLGASDIHIEPRADKTVVRMRVDGALFEQSEIAPTAHDSVIARLKIMGNMNIAERRLPQDGRFGFTHGGKSIDVRISVMPLIHGEKAVMRILGNSAKALLVEQLGMDAKNLKLFREIIKLPHGMILSCGPTGSGKTTTIYSILREISLSSLNTITIEDPVEYEIEGVNQIQVNNKIGLDFVSGLQYILRQDPDIIMVGEIRDEKAASIAVSAAATGHIVLSTIHTNDAAGAVSRLLNMKIPAYIVSSSVAAIVSQRLVRVLCRHCAKLHTTGHHEMELLGMNTPAEIYEENGCKLCNFTGFSGRRAVFEILPVTSAIRELIDAGAPIDRIRAAAAVEGATSLRESCKAAVLSGETSISEFLKVMFSI